MSAFVKRDSIFFWNFLHSTEQGDKNFLHGRLKAFFSSFFFSRFFSSPGNQQEENFQLKLWFFGNLLQETIQVPFDLFSRFQFTATRKDFLLIVLTNKINFLTRKKPSVEQKSNPFTLCGFHVALNYSEKRVGNRKMLWKIAENVQQSKRCFFFNHKTGLFAPFSHFLKVLLMIFKGLHLFFPNPIHMQRFLSTVVHKFMFWHKLCSCIIESFI